MQAGELARAIEKARWVLQPRRIWPALVLAAACSSSSVNEAGAAGSGGGGTGGVSGVGGEAGSTGGQPGGGGAGGQPSGGAGGGGGSGGPADAGGAGGDAGGADGGGGTAGCSGGSGPKTVAVSSPTGTKYCIDATEVTQAQYAAFLAATQVTPPTQPAVCSWNTSFAWEAGTAKCPAGAINPASKAGYPMACIDWCDARAYCAWAGKRLCGRIGGGANAYADHAKAAASEWYSACSNKGTSLYPYGSTYNASACTSSQPHSVGSAPACEGGFPKLFDMSGNVWEFEDSCNASAGSGDCCRVRGGGFGVVNAGNTLRCDDVGGLCITRSHREQTVGFRCCADFKG